MIARTRGYATLRSALHNGATVAAASFVLATLALLGSSPAAAAAQQPSAGSHLTPIASGPSRGLRAGGLRRRDLRLRARCRVLRLPRRVTTQQADRRHGRRSRRSGLLAGGLRWRHLQLRPRRRVLRSPRRVAAQQARSSAWRQHPTDRATGSSPLTAASSVMVQAPSSSAPLAIVDSEQAHRRHGRPRPMGRATGWWPLTAGSSPSAPPCSSAPTAGRRSTHPSSAWRRHRTDRATGSSPPTAASSSYGPMRLVLRRPRWVAAQRAHRRHGRRCPTDRATGSSPLTAASSPTGRAPRSSVPMAGRRSTSRSLPWRPRPLSPRA